MSIKYYQQGEQTPRRVWFTGSTALVRGQGVCFDMDYYTANDDEAATDPWQIRGTAVALPAQSNSDYFAGVCVRDYKARSGGQMIEIWEPGSICEVAYDGETVTIGDILTCCGKGAPGCFTDEGFRGIGSAKVLQTVSSATQLESDMTAANALLKSGNSGTKLNDSAAAFSTNGVEAGDYVYIIAGTNDGTDSISPGRYVVSSVTDDNNLLLTSSAITDGGAGTGDLECAYFIVPKEHPRVLVLLDGPQYGFCEQSGLIEYVMPPEAGHASNNTFTVSQYGKTFLVGGITVGTANARAQLSDGFYGQKKAFECTGTVTTNDYEISLASDGWTYCHFSSSNAIFSTGSTYSATDTPAFGAITFDAADEEAFLEFDGRWRAVYHRGAELDRS